MALVGVGLIVIYALGGLILFILCVLIVRWVLGIGKIVDLLTTIAQELRAANAVGTIDAKLKKVGITPALAEYLTKVAPKKYAAGSEAPLPSTDPPKDGPASP